VSTQVNLLPPETRERQVARRQTAFVVLGGILAIGLIGLIYFLQTVTASDVQDQIDRQQATNAALQARVQELQRFEEIQAQLEARRGLVDQALTGEISWSGVLRDLSRIIPTRMWLTDLDAKLASVAAAGGTTTTTTTAPTTPTVETSPAATTPTTTTAPVTGLAGTLALNGESLDTSTLSLWLTRLESLTGWVNAWISKAQKTATGATSTYQFSSSVDLTAEALARRRI
jgi:Tfp pilus assembly protein PilN